MIEAAYEDNTVGLLSSSCCIVVESGWTASTILAQETTHLVVGRHGQLGLVGRKM